MRRGDDEVALSLGVKQNQLQTLDEFRVAGNLRSAQIGCHPLGPARLLVVLGVDPSFRRPFEYLGAGEDRKQQPNADCAQRDGMEQTFQAAPILKAGASI